MTEPPDDKQAQHVADRGETKGREDNAARPPRTMDQDVEPERYPSVRQDDSVEMDVERRDGRGGGPADVERG